MLKNVENKGIVRREWANYVSTILREGSGDHYKNHFRKHWIGDNMNQNELREKLNITIENGLVAKAIAAKTGIKTDILSRFKNEHICLCEADASRLSAYLDKVVIP